MSGGLQNYISRVIVSGFICQQKYVPVGIAAPQQLSRHYISNPLMPGTALKQLTRGYP